MGIAITSGVLASLHSQSPLHGLNSGQPKWESHTPGTSTPAVAGGDDPTLPSRFIACVQREESARRLRDEFRAVLGGDAVDVTVGENVSAVQQSDVVLLWYVWFIIILAFCIGKHFSPLTKIKIKI
jgi:pyrroline-5-carboxylate reductase